MYRRRQNWRHDTSSVILSRSFFFTSEPLQNDWRGSSLAFLLRSIPSHPKPLGPFLLFLHCAVEGLKELETMQERRWLPAGIPSPVPGAQGAPPDAAVDLAAVPGSEERERGGCREKGLWHGLRQPCRPGGSPHAGGRKGATAQLWLTNILFLFFLAPVTFINFPSQQQFKF